MEEDLQRLVEDFLTQKQILLVQVKKGMNVDDHFNQAVDMVRIGSGSFRKVNIFRLSRMACMIVAENADAQKVLVQQARDYFTRTISTNELNAKFVEF